MSVGKQKKVADALNELGHYNMRNSAGPSDILCTLTEYFLQRDSDTESDASSSSSENSNFESDSEDDKFANNEEGRNNGADRDELIKLVAFAQNTDSELGDSDTTGTGYVTSEPVIYGFSRDIIENGDDESGDLPILNDEVATAINEVSKTAVPQDSNQELRNIRQFNCGCKQSKEGKCIKLFEEKWVMDMRSNMQEMNEAEKDLIIMAKLSCTINNSTETVCNKHRREKKKRTRQCTKYLVEGKTVCRESFKFLHLISSNKLTACLTWYKEHGLCPRRKKSGGRVLTGHALTFEDIERIVSFLTNFAEKHALVLPGRVPGFKRSDVKLLPSSETKASIWRKYTVAIKDQGFRAAKLSSFKAVWRQLVPHIVKTKPMSDLCFECQKNNHAIYRAANLPDIVKTAKLKKQEKHLAVVEREREVYRTMVNDSKRQVKELSVKKLCLSEPCSRDIEMHYSFDFAQQVHFPHDPYQPGPIYFLTPRKCAIFGICCEALPQQVNYLIDEGMAFSKGSNAVISYLHHFFASYGFGEKICHLHCDNCSGQNKNKFLVWYMLWRTFYCLHFEVTLNFLITGHTEFAPDWCFGLLKQKYRKTEVNTLRDIVEVVESSTPESQVNRAQLAGNEKGDVYVPAYNWQEFLSPFFKPLQGIKAIHCMRFSYQHPGVVFVRQTSDQEEKAIHLLKDSESPPSPTTATCPPSTGFGS